VKIKEKTQDLLSAVSRPWLAAVLWSVALLFAALMVISFIHGFPFEPLGLKFLRFKSLRKPFEISFILFMLGVLLHPKRAEIAAGLRQKGEKLARSPRTIWILTAVYFLLFLWQQVSKYLALEINFIPFLFYDYMLWFFDRGRFCFTGHLHGYYHTDLILLLFYPLWKVVQSGWLLQVALPLLKALAAPPLYFWSRERLKSPGLGLAAAFVYLNFRYVQNLLHVSFAVEVFYPLFIFSAVYFASKRQNVFYYLAVLLGLTVKEDAVLYFGALGMFLLVFQRDGKRGLVTVLLSVLYGVFLLKVFLPWSGSDIFQRSLQNYPGLGSTPHEQLRNLVSQPWLFIRELFIPLDKVRTVFKLTSKLLFLPFFSPWFLMVIISIYPLFFQSTGRGDLFFQLSFYYAAAVLPFLFLAFVDGWGRIEEKIPLRAKGVFRGGVVGLVVFLNAFNLRPLHSDRDDWKTISLAKRIPKEAVVVTQGHLLPYVGYRTWNFYLARPYGKNKETRDAYSNPDYYLFDFEANAYPLSSEELREKGRLLKEDGRWRVAYEDHRRLLLERQ
jgi:uncharacterized membrane protein